MRTPIWHDDRVRTTIRRRLVAVALLLPVLLLGSVGCVRVKTSLTVSADDKVSGQVIAAAKPRNEHDTGPQLSPDVPFSQKVAISKYNRDGFVGTQAVFSDLTFGELPQLANMNPESAGVDLSLRRSGNLVILDGRVDLTSLNDPAAEVVLSITFPGEVTSTNGDRIAGDSVQWKLQPGVVSTMNAQARYTDPSTSAFTSAAIRIGLGSLLVAALIAWLAWQGRDRSPRVGDEPADPVQAA